MRITDELNPEKDCRKRRGQDLLPAGPGSILNIDIKFKHYIFQLLTVYLLSGCSTSDTVPVPRMEPDSDLDYRGTDCILIRTIRDYSPLDDRHMLIHGAGRRPYFVTLIRSTFEMRSAMGLRFESRDDQLCPFGGDAIVFGDFAHDRIGISSISRITPEQEERLLVRFGIKEPAEQRPREPAEVKGAEVEELD